jgi:hypothetical protein
MRDKVAAAAEMRAYGAALRRMKEASPADDLASELTATEVDGNRLTEGEFEAFFRLLFNAGTDTTRSLLCYGLDALLDRPALIERLRAEPSSLPRAIDEILRFEPPVIQIRRTAARPLVKDRFGLPQHAASRTTATHVTNNPLVSRRDVCWTPADRPSSDRMADRQRGENDAPSLHVHSRTHHHLSGGHDARCQFSIWGSWPMLTPGRPR